MYLRPSTRSKGAIFPNTILPVDVPRTIQVARSGTSLCSVITLDDDLFVAIVSQRPNIPKPSSDSEMQSPSANNVQPKESREKRAQDPVLSQSEHSGRPFCRMELDVSAHRDSPPNPKILLRRCTEPLHVASRKACLQDLSCLEDGRKTMLVNRFSPPPCDYDYFAPPVSQFKRASSDESYASMPPRMPIRKASMEDIQLIH